MNINLPIIATIEPLEEMVLSSLAMLKAKDDAVCVEVGSWKGHSSVVIARALRENGGHLYCVDHWDGSVGTSMVKEAEDEDIYKSFKCTLVAYEVQDYITPMKMDSVKASKRFKDNSIDFLFLDGDHRYEQFKADIDAWLPKVKEGGMACGHDAEAYYSLLKPEFRDYLEEYIGDDCHKGYHIGVMKGLNEYFKDTHNLVEDTRIWFKEV